MSMIQGIGLAGYRSFPSDRMSYLGRLGKVNLIAGQNNAGKSNILRLVQRASDEKGSGQRLEMLDRPSGEPSSSSGATFAIGYDPSLLDGALSSAFAKLSWAPHDEQTVLKYLRELLIIDDSSGLLWLRYALGNDRRGLELDSGWIRDLAASAHQGGARAMSKLSGVLTQTSGGAQGEDLSRILMWLFGKPQLPPVQTINAFRQIRTGALGESDLSHDGSGLIERLDALESPDASDYFERAKFDAIQEFVRAVLDDPGVEITIPTRRHTINILRGAGRPPLPLENMGTGIHQVVILAVAATLLTETLVCMEEPEIHLHPLLQRKLLRYLATKTSNQYLIATHSAHMLDSDLASIFHVSLTDSGTTVRPAVLPQHRAEICADLGYRASDLVQANAIVWVEGPSDRIYLQAWLSTRAPGLVEGIHFSIMFYGGRLLNHLSANDSDVEAFISLRRLNRHVAVIIDSDKTSAGKRINATKKRVRDEVEEGEGVAWVTAGYTIENYVPISLLHRAIHEVHRTAKVEDFERYDNPLKSPAVSKPDEPDKIAVARRVVGLADSETVWQFDLEERMREMIKFIYAANGSVVPA